MSLKEKIVNRARPTTIFSLRIQDDTAARAELAQAQAAGIPVRVKAATEALESCYEKLTLQALPPADLEALIEAHPPSGDSKKDALFNEVTFVPALLAASVVNSGMSEDEWAQVTTKGPLTRGEVVALFQAAFELNHRVPDPFLTSGSTGMSS